MSENRLRNNLRIAQLVVCGAVIGFYMVRGSGLLGLETTLHAETLGAGFGAGLVAVLKLVHWL